MTAPRVHTVLCGELATTEDDVPRSVRLVVGPDKTSGCNLCLDLDGLEARLAATRLPDRVEDLLVLSAYVLGADCAVERGRPEDDNLGKDWIRTFRFRVPVLDPDFWSQQSVTSLLQETLGFLSGDNYGFEFVKRQKIRSQQLGLWPTNGVSLKSWDHIDRVMLFSGGLDSLTGAAEELLAEQHGVALVSHRSSGTMRKAQDNLVGHLRRRAAKQEIEHVGIRFEKRKTNLSILTKKLDRERTQRTRSFLFAAMAGAVAGLTGKDLVRFYENGIVSYNLPIARQALAAKSSRTTHPLVLRGFQRLLTAVFERPFVIDNPYIDLTRAEVIQRLDPLGAVDLVAASISCAHVIESSEAHPHCGVCSQCIDRRFALDSLGRTWPEDDFTYRKQVFTDALDDEEDRLYLLAYIDAADRWASQGSATDFLTSFGEAARAITGAIQGVSLDADTALQQIFELHKRHGAVVASVVDRRFGSARRGLAAGRFERNTLPWLLLRRIVDPDSEDQAKAAYDQERRVFRRKGDFWEIEFDGKSNHLVKHGLGMEVIHRLLSNRNQCVKVMDVDSPGYRQAAATNSLGPKADKRARQRTERERHRLLGLLREAEEMGHMEEVIDLKRELGQYDDYRNDTQLPSGRARLDNEKAKQARDRVRTNYKTALKHIAAHYAELAAHLEEKVTGINGYNPAYMDDGPSWILE